MSILAISCGEKNNSNLHSNEYSETNTTYCETKEYSKTNTTYCETKETANKTASQPIYSMNNIFVDPEERIADRGFRVVSIPNPMHQNISMTYVGIMDAPTESYKEVAETNPHTYNNGGTATDINRYACDSYNSNNTYNPNATGPSIETYWQQPEEVDEATKAILDLIEYVK